MEDEIFRKFRVKNGYCHISKDLICFTDNGVLDNSIDKDIRSHNALDIKLVFGIVATALGTFLIYNLNLKGYSFNFLFLPSILFFVFIIFLIITSSYKSVHRIKRDRIVKVKIRKSLTSSNYNRFLISFRNDNNKIRHALVFLLDPLISGDYEYQYSLAILKEEKIIEINT